MLVRLLDPKIPDVKWRILQNLDQPSLLRCRRVSIALKQTIDRHFQFNGKLSDRKLRRRSKPFSVEAVQHRVNDHVLIPQSHTLNQFTVNGIGRGQFVIKKLVIGKLMHSLKKLPLNFGTWDTIEEIEFTAAVTSRNYHALLRACRLVQTIRVNYLALGGQKSKSFITLRRLFQKPQVEQQQQQQRYRSIDLDTNYFLPNLRSIHIDRGLNTTEFIENRNRNKYKHFDSDLYFKTMAALIDDLEKEVQESILEMLRVQIENRIQDDPKTGFFFTKPSFVNRFPMNNEILNKFLIKLRPT